jgi:hypothetical protein
MRDVFAVATVVDPAGRPRPDMRVCWYSGMRLVKCRDDAAGLDRHFSATVEHLIPKCWRLPLDAATARANELPAAHCLNNFVGCLPVFMKWEFRERLRRAFAGRAAPREGDKEAAAAVIQAIRERWGVVGRYTPLFSSTAWMGARPDLYEREREFFAAAGLDLDALIDANPHARGQIDGAALARVAGAAYHEQERPDGSVLRWCYDVDGFYKETARPDGSFIRWDGEGRVHCSGGPAVRRADGALAWFERGARLDGPAADHEDAPSPRP